MTNGDLGVLSRTFSPGFDATVVDQGNGFGRVVSRILNAFNAPTVYPVGPDVSYWQGIIDWDIMASKAQFVIIRAGIGNVALDSRLEYNVSNAAARGIPYGLYWYVKPAHDAKKHADSFAAAVKAYGGTLPPVFDLEETGGLDKNALYNWYAKLYNRFAEVSGLEFPEMMTYTSAGFLDRSVPLTNFLKWTQLWVAHWTTAPQPIIPQEWAKSGKTWRYWQYTSKGPGAEYGAQSKSIDLNRKNEQIPEPPPEEDEMRYKVIVTPPADPYLNVRQGPGTNTAIVGTMPNGTIFTISDVKLGYPACSLWSIIKGGEYDGKYACLELNRLRYCQVV